eukprot:524076-Pyramimonas_sp.AAC.2
MHEGCSESTQAHARRRMASTAAPNPRAIADSSAAIVSVCHMREALSHAVLQADFKRLVDWFGSRLSALNRSPASTHF